MMVAWGFIVFIEIFFLQGVAYVMYGMEWYGRYPLLYVC